MNIGDFAYLNKPEKSLCRDQLLRTLYLPIKPGSVRLKLVLMILLFFEMCCRKVSPSGKYFKLCQGPIKMQKIIDVIVRAAQITIMFEKVNEVETIRWCQNKGNTELTVVAVPKRPSKSRELAG